MRSDENAITYLHRLHRQLVWSRFGRSGSGRLKRAAKRAVAPFFWYVQPALLATSEVRERWDFVRSADGVGVIRQWLGCVAFTASFRACPSSYFDYRLFVDERWARRKQYLYYDEMWSLLDFLNRALGPRDAADLSDKRRFHDRAVQAGLPIIPILAEFDQGAIVHKPWPADSATSDLFSKFANLWYGEGACVWRRGADGAYSGDAGTGLSRSEVFEVLRKQSFQRPLILQPRISNHPQLRDLSGKGLSTVRAVTTRDTQDRIELALACFRMAVGRLVADNFAAGGMAAPIGLDDGRLGSAVFKSMPGAFDAHPDTGAAILGRSLPYWPDVKRLAVAAHQEFHSLPSIGWDIAITGNGPIIVEGNSEWGTNVVQFSHRRPLAETVIPARLAEHFDRLGQA